MTPSLLRRVAVWPVRLYQWTISPVLPRSCRFTPSCSQYAIDAVLAHGLARGGCLALWRLLRCNPWSAGGFDPVPPGPSSSPSSRHQEQPDHHGR